jgi:hypothetical protein
MRHMMEGFGCFVNRMMDDLGRRVDWMKMMVMAAVIVVRRMLRWRLVVGGVCH